MLLRKALHRFVPRLARTRKLSAQQWKAVNSIQLCRTPALGGEERRCDNVECAKTQRRYHSCRNRHCPVCQGERARQWIEGQSGKLLPVSYFHVVFTIPRELHSVFRFNEAFAYDLLFKAAAETLQSFFANPLHVGAQGGFIGVLHTWGQQLQYHPHVHFIVPNGGVDRAGNWVEPRRKDCGRFLFPVRALTQVFRGKLLSMLERCYHQGKLRFANEHEAASLRDELNRAAAKSWNVYSKRPFAGPQQVIRYLSGYTHRVGLSPKRIVSVDEHTVTFSYRDRTRREKKTLTLEGAEFTRRFLQHILPHRFRKIRAYGWYNGNAYNRLSEGLLRWFRERARYATILAHLQRIREPSQECHHHRCAHCGQGGLVHERLLPAKPIASGYG